VEVRFAGFDVVRCCLVLVLGLGRGAGVLSLRRLAEGPSREVLLFRAIIAIAEISISERASPPKRERRLLAMLSRGGNSEKDRCQDLDAQHHPATFLGRMRKVTKSHRLQVLHGQSRKTRIAT
jgi:hypothetical protein